MFNLSPEGQHVFDIIGLVCIIIVVFYILKYLLVTVLYHNFLDTALGINAIDLTKTGKWAVVTGATDGIGKAYAEELAKKHLNIVLISRTQSKLDDVAGQLQTTYKVETKTISADFTGLDIYDNIEKQLHGLDIGILINNVGLYHPYPEYFLDLKNKDKIYNDIMNCNMFSVTNMCKIVLPGMVQRKRGVVVNISSSLVTIPSPLVTIYAATKAFVEKFSEDLLIEYKKDGITIQCTLPALVATKLVGVTTSSWATPFPEKYVKSAIATIGVREKTTGFFPHSVFVGLVNFFGSISPRLSRWIMLREMLKTRSKALENQVP